eukprot:m.18408 g.18408  ORF g.18408 m.18408 type:complete len:331 (+) comp10804_c0_seq1:42-1034(+)
MLTIGRVMMAKECNCAMVQIRKVVRSIILLFLIQSTLTSTFNLPPTATDHAIFAVNEERRASIFKTVKYPTAILALDDFLLVSSFMTNQVIKIEWKQPLQVSNVSVFASGRGLDGPWGLTYGNGMVYIASFATDEIHLYATNGTFMTSIGGEVWLDGPEGLALSQNSQVLYVASFINDQIVAFSWDGMPLEVIATRRDGLMGPEHLTRQAGSDLLYAANHFKDAITVIDPNHHHVRTLTSIPRPVGLTFGLDGLLYATSYTTNSVIRINATSGDVLDTFASGKTMLGPSALRFATPRLLLIACYDSHQVLAFNSTSGLTFAVYQNDRTQA